MNKTITTAKILSDGSVVEVLDDGRLQPLSSLPMRLMSDEEIKLAAEADVDARPMTEDELRSVRRVPRVKTMRRALGLTQEAFSTRYHVPLGTLRDWEQGRAEPDQPTQAYLTVIAHDPEGCVAFYSIRDNSHKAWLPNRRHKVLMVADFKMIAALTDDI